MLDFQTQAISLKGGFSKNTFLVFFKGLPSSFLNIGVLSTILPSIFFSIAYYVTKVIWLQKIKSMNHT